MIIIDFEKAYDTTWRDGLICTLYLFSFPTFLIKILRKIAKIPSNIHVQKLIADSKSYLLLNEGVHNCHTIQLTQEAIRTTI